MGRKWPFYMPDTGSLTVSPLTFPSINHNTYIYIYVCVILVKISYNITVPSYSPNMVFPVHRNCTSTILDIPCE